MGWIRQSPGATAANQALELALLTNIDSNLPTPNVTVTDTITALNDTVEISLAGRSSVGFTVTGTWTGTLIYEVTYDDTNWVGVFGYAPNTSTPTLFTTTSSNTSFCILGATGAAKFRLRASSWSSGTATCTLVASNVAPGTVNVATVSIIGTSVTPGTSTLHLGKAEDAAHTTGSTGVFVLGVRNDNKTVFTSATGDYSPAGTNQFGDTRISEFSANRSDTFTATGNGTTIDVNTDTVKSFSIAVKGTAAAATLWDVHLEGSLDNVNFTTLINHVTATGDGVTLFSGAVLSPCRYFRSRCAALTLGGATNIVVQILGVQ